MPPPAHFLPTLTPVTLVGAATESCLTVMTFPAAVTVPVRVSPVRLRLTEKLNVPLPWPLDTLVVIQSVELVADHEQVAAPAVTVTVAVEPVAIAVTESGVTPKVQEPAAWLTV